MPTACGMQISFTILVDTAQIEGQPGLQIILKDAAYGLKVSADYRVLPELDLMQRWIV